MPSLGCCLSEALAVSHAQTCHLPCVRRVQLRSLTSAFLGPSTGGSPSGKLDSSKTGPSEPSSSTEQPNQDSGGSSTRIIDESRDAGRADKLLREADEIKAEELDNLDSAVVAAAHAKVKARADAHGYAAAAQHALQEATAARVQSDMAARAASKATAALAEAQMRRRSQIDTFLGNGMADYHAAKGAAMGAYVEQAMQKQAPTAPLFFQGDVATAATL